MSDLSTATEEEKHNDAVRESIRSGALLNFDFLFMNMLATIIACYGLFENSAAVIIGAMIIAMLLNPILGSALALVDSDKDLLKKALITLIGGILGIMVVAFSIGFIHSEIPLTNEIMARTEPNLFDLIIALAGGAAGAYATVAPRLSGAFVGVAIATALVPPLSSSSILLARGEYHLASGAFLLAFTNIVAIQFAASVVMWFTGFNRVKCHLERTEIKKFLKKDMINLLILATLAIILTINLKQSVSRKVYENNVNQILKDEIERPKSYNSLAKVSFEKTSSDLIIIRTIVSGIESPTIDQVKMLENKLPLLSDHIKNELRISFVHISEINRDGIVQDIANIDLTKKIP